LFCWVHQEERQVSELSDQKWIKLAKEAVTLKPDNFVISGGGEPMLRSKLVLDLMNVAKQAKISGDLITNGCFVNDDFANRIVALGWESIHVTLHGSNEKIDSIVRNRKNSLNPTLEGIRKIVHCKNLQKKKFPTIMITMVITKYNYGDISKMVKLASDLDIQGVTIRLVNENCPEFTGDLSVKNKHFQAFYDQIRQAQEYALKNEIELITDFDINEIRDCIENKKINASFESNLPLKKYCPLPFSELVVFSNGLISPCCNFFGFVFDPPEPNFPGVDDVSKKSLKDVWTGKNFTKFRNMINKGDFPETCNGCPADLRHTIQRYEK